MALLFDASSFVNIMMQRGEDALNLMRGQQLLDLTLYEVGNSIWKLRTLTRKLNEEDVNALINVAMNVANRIKVIQFSQLSFLDTMKVAFKDGITFYDATYIQVAKSRELTLVTDDATLASIASKYTQVKSSRELKLSAGESFEGKGKFAGNSEKGL